MTAPGSFVRELREAGFSVESPWDLVNERQPYRAAIPVLLDWLDRAETELPASERQSFREGIVRSLSVREARGMAAPALVREFRRSGASSDYRWAVGNALEVVADDSVFEDIVKLARCRDYGRDRQMVVLALARMTNPHTVGVLRELVDDDDVAGHAVMALGRLKAQVARPEIERCLHHHQPWVPQGSEEVPVEAGQAIGAATALSGSRAA